MIYNKKTLFLCTVVLCTFIITQSLAAVPAQSVSTQTLAPYINKNIKPPHGKPYHITLERLSPTTWRALRTDDGVDNVFEIDAEFFADAKDKATTPTVLKRPVTRSVLLRHQGRIAGFYEYTYTAGDHPLPLFDYIEVFPEWQGSGAVDVLLEDFVERVLKGDRNARFKAYLGRGSDRIVKHPGHDENIYTISTVKEASGIISTVTYAPHQTYNTYNKISPKEANPLLQSQGKGVLDGRTILRFSHVYDTIGGVQTYLKDLDKELLERNQLTIIQLYFSPTENKATVQKIGKGVLILVPIYEPERVETLQKKRDIMSLVMQCIRKTNLMEFMRWGYRLASRLGILHFMQRFSWFESLAQKKWSIQPDYIRSIVRTILNSYPVDLVMLHAEHILDIEMIIQEAKSRNIPIAALYHGENEKLRRYIPKRILQQVDHVSLVTGVHIPSYLRHKTTVLFDGIDMTLFKERPATELSLTDPVLKQKWVLTKEDMVVTLPARIHQTKGNFDMLAALVRIRRIIPNIRLVFAGPFADALIQEKMVAIINKHTLYNNVIFTGALTQKELTDVYAISDVIALPSHSEGLPRVLLEAQSMGKPVVAYDVGGTSEAMIPHGNKQTGILVKKFDVRGLAHAIETLFTNKTLYQKLQQHARPFVEETFTREKLAERHEEFYCQVIGEQDNTINEVEAVPAIRHTRDVRLDTDDNETLSFVEVAGEVRNGKLSFTATHEEPMLKSA
jgi:glycosyltransferase involved in cell wall biosynthesis